MPTLWFCLVAIMIAVYVLLDGFDLGAGIVHLGVAHTDAERRAVLSTIGPVWDANEVWLLAAAASSSSRFRFLRFKLQWILFAADDGVVAVDSARAYPWNSEATFPGRYGRRSGMLCFVCPAGCWRFFTARRWGTSCAACRLTRKGISSSHCGRISGSGKIPAFSTGTRYWLDWPHTWLWRSMARCGWLTKPKAK